MDENLAQKWARFDNWPVSSHLWLVILVGFLAISVQVWLFGDRLPQSSAAVPIQHAVSLHKDGIFGPATADASGTPAPAMFYSPLYMAFAAGAMELDQGLTRSLTCLARAANPEQALKCKTALRPFYLVQALILALVPFFAWLMTWQLSGRKAFAWGAVLLVLLSGRPAAYATGFSTDVLTLPLFAALLLSLVVAIQSRFWLWFVATGLACGLLALTEPDYAWVFYGLLPVLAYWRAAHEQNSRWFWITLATLALPYLVVTGPWMWRNYLHFDTAVLSQGYIASLLAERLAWNSMTILEVAVSFVHSLGGIGPDLAASAYPEDGWRRLVPGAADGLYQTGDAMARQVMAAAGSAENQPGFLFAEKIWPEFGKHLTVSLALIWRGLWIGSYWSLIVVPLAFAYGAVCISRGRSDIVMPLSLCGFVMALHAFTSVNDPARNDILVPMFSVLVAMLVGEWARHRLADS